VPSTRNIEGQEGPRLRRYGASVVTSRRIDECVGAEETTFLGQVIQELRDPRSRVPRPAALEANVEGRPHPGGKEEEK
jgi:hypothetical protein